MHTRAAAIPTTPRWIASALSSRLTKPASSRHLGADVIGTLQALRRKISSRVFGGAASL
jgi:hypothetical protein